MQKPMTENKMGVMPVKPLLISMALPMALSMMVQALYNTVDSIYVSRIATTVDSAALSALSLAGPMQNMMIAIAAGTAVGVNALVSKSLGEREFDRANRAAGNALTLSALGWLLFVAVGLFLAEPFMRVQTDIGEIVDFGTQYLRIVCVASLGLFMEIMLERLLQSTGRAILSMYTQGLGAILNIVLDPIFIFGWFGLPAMGVAGAAIATVIGQICAMLFALLLNVKKNDDLRFSFGALRLRARVVRDIFAVGAPSIVMMSIGSVMVYAMNAILLTFSSVATAVFGVYFKLQSFVFMPIFGLNNALVPIVAYNYGARKKARITGAMKFAMVCAVALMALGTAVFELIPAQLLMMFDASESMLSIGVPALRIIGVHFPVAGFCIVAGGVFQAMRNGVYSMWTSITRQLVVLIPAAWLLAQTGNLDLVWLSFPIAEVFSMLLSALFLRRTFRTKINLLEN